MKSNLPPLHATMSTVPRAKRPDATLKFSHLAEIPRKLECCIRSLRSRYCTHACCASRYGIASQPSAKPGQFDSGCGEIESSMLMPKIGPRSEIVSKLNFLIHPML